MKTRTWSRVPKGTPTRREVEDLSPRLDAAAVFVLTYREALRDGVVVPGESTWIHRLQAILGLDERTRDQLVLKVYREYEKKALARGGALDLRTVYRRACLWAWQDKKLELGEEVLLMDLAELLKIPAAEARRVIDATRLASHGA